jgi:hypothetical protein
MSIIEDAKHSLYNMLLKNNPQKRKSTLMTGSMSIAPIKLDRDNYNWKSFTE